MSWSVHSWNEIPGLLHGFGGRQGEDPPANVVTLRQVHGQRVLRSREVLPGEEGDGLLCDRSGESAGVWTADCVPILLVAPPVRVAAAIHSGWRGTLAGIVDEALTKFGSDYGVDPSDVEVALGPSIGGCCYEVSEEIRDAFQSSYPSSHGFSEHNGQIFLDLRIFLAESLHRSGVRRIKTVGPCTACRTDILYSFRKEGKTGRQFSFIGWR